MWCEIFSPENDKDSPIINQNYEIQISYLLDNAKLNKSPFGKVFCISGHSGVGKTTILTRLCRQQSIEMINFAPDDQNNSDNESISVNLKNFLQVASLSRVNSRLIVIDGIEIPEGEFYSFIRVLRFSPVLVAWIIPVSLINNPYIPFPIQYMNQPQFTGIQKIIKYISKKVNISIEQKDLIALVRNSKGDIRSAINTFQFGQFLYSDFPQNAREMASRIIRGDARDVSFEALEYVHDILTTTNEDFDGLINSFECFSSCDIYLSEEKNLQTFLAMSIASQNKNLRPAPVLSLEEQFSKNLRSVPPVVLTDEDKRAIEELKESLAMLDFDPIEEEEETPF